MPERINPQAAERIKWETALMEQRLQFQRCSCNDCPLDPLYGQRGQPDKEHSCRARKSTRLVIIREAEDKGIRVELPCGGLTRREYGNLQRSIKAKAQWEALSAEEKHKRLSHLQPYGAK